MNTTIVVTTWSTNPVELIQPDVCITIVHDWAGVDELISALHLLAMAQAHPDKPWTWPELVRYIQANLLRPPLALKITAWSVFRTNMQVVDGSHAL